MLKQEIVFGQTKVGYKHPPYIIAEMACAHDGNFDKAMKLIDATKTAGANAIQLQFFQTNHVVTPHHEAFNILGEIEFSQEQWGKLFDYAKKIDLDVLICTYDMPSVELAIKLIADGIKLNSADLSNSEVITAVAKSKIPFTLGTGASTLEEISNGLRIAEINGAEEVVLMHGVQNFPTQIQDLNIDRVTLLKEVFEIPVGYHDHVDGEDPFGKIVDLIAIGVGASIIEKHITLDRSEKGIDYQASLEPEEFKVFVNNIRLANVAKGSKSIRPFSESDLKYRKFQKKSIVAKNTIEKGSEIKRDDLIFLRNESPGIAPIQLNEILNMKANKDISQFENITLDHLTN